jgi:hypothetical protein
MEGANMGTLIGKVTVEPVKPVAGQSVLVQGRNPSGQPLSDPTIAPTIMDVPASGRYPQFATPGTRKLIIRAVRGAVSENTDVIIEVGASTAASATQILQVKQVASNPYSATFTLGTPPRLRPVIARQVAQASATKTAAQHPAPPTPVGKGMTPTYKWDFWGGQAATTPVTDRYSRLLQCERGGTGSAQLPCHLHSPATVRLVLDAVNNRGISAEGRIACHR